MRKRKFKPVRPDAACGMIRARFRRGIIGRLSVGITDANGRLLQKWSFSASEY
jgi:F420-0:gamma-glutamyl ligase